MIKWLMRTKIYSYVVLYLVPKIRFSTSYAKFDGESYDKLKATLKNGDVLVMVDEYKLSSFLIPEKWSHAGIYFDGYVYEMVTPHIKKTHLYDFCKASNEVAAYRCPLFPYEYIKEMHKLADKLLKLKVPYDVMFADDYQKLYCSELVIYLDFKKYIVCDRTKSLGLSYVSPTDLTQSNMERVF